MPRETKPAWGYRKWGIRSQDKWFRYTGAQKSLISGSLPVRLQPEDIGLLEHHAEAYLLFKQNVDEAPRAAVKAALMVLLRSPDPSALIEEIVDDRNPGRVLQPSKIDEETLRLLARAMERLPSDFSECQIAHWARAPGRVRLRLVGRYPEEVRKEILRRCTLLALDLFPERYPVQVGRRPLWALRWYVDQLADFYRAKTGKRPRRWVDPAGQDTGPFLNFVCKALSPVDPSATPAHVIRLVSKKSP
jgi:hypothetical protein